MNRNDHPTPAPSGAPTADQPDTAAYEIRVAGHLGTRWAAWFDGMSLADQDDGTTVIRGPVVDQAALHGVIQKLRDVGLTLISLTPASPDDTTTPGPTPRPDEGN